MSLFLITQSSNVFLIPSDTSLAVAAWLDPRADWMGKMKRRVLCRHHSRYLQRIRCRRQWCRVMLHVMQYRDPVTTPTKRKCTDVDLHCPITSFFKDFPGLARFIGTKILLYYRLKDTIVIDLTCDRDSCDESSGYTSLDSDSSNYFF